MDPSSTPIFLSCDGDLIGRLVGRARLADDVEGVRRVDAAIRAGQEALTSWALARGGSTVESGGDEALLEVPAGALTELEALRERYHKAVGATLSVGVGRKISESAKALLIAKLRGRNRAVVYTRDLESEIDAARHAAEAQPPAVKEAAEYLGDAPPIDEPVAKADPGDYLATSDPRNAPPPVDHEGEFRRRAEVADQAERAAALDRGQRVTELRQRTAQALEKIRVQLPALQQVRQLYPAAYQAVAELGGAVVELARGLGEVHDRIEAHLAAAPPLTKREGDGYRVTFAFDTERQAKVFAGAAEKLRAGCSDRDGSAVDVRADDELLLDDLRNLAQAVAVAPEAEEQDKAEVPAHRHLDLPVGTVTNGEVKVREADGRTAWRGVRAGMIQGQTPHEALYGANSHPVSSREPNSP